MLTAMPVRSPGLSGALAARFIDAEVGKLPPVQCARSIARNMQRRKGFLTKEARSRRAQKPRLSNRVGTKCSRMSGAEGH
jgi:hypothetical protein